MLVRLRVVRAIMQQWALAVKLKALLRHHHHIRTPIADGENQVVIFHLEVTKSPRRLREHGGGCAALVLHAGAPDCLYHACKQA